MIEYRANYSDQSDLMFAAWITVSPSEEFPQRSTFHCGHRNARRQVQMAGLAAPQCRIGSIASKQFLVRAGFHQPAAFHNEDAVEGYHLLKPVRHRDNRAIARNAR
jgi:hypothetical protein